MVETDRQTDKTTRWAFTAYEDQWSLFTVMPDLIAEWGWQTEICPDTQRPHYQGYLRTKRQVRFSQIKTILPGVHIEQARDWNKLLNYCKKSDSAVAGSQIHASNPSKAMTMAQALVRIANNLPYLHIDFFNCDDPESAVENRNKNEFWSSVNEILKEDPDAVGLYTQPQYLRAWMNTRDVWIELATSPLSSSSQIPEDPPSPSSPLFFLNEII